VSGLDKDETKKFGWASIHKLQEKKAVIERWVGIDRGISQKNQVTFGSCSK
jgi:hypothetical protein